MTIRQLSYDDNISTLLEVSSGQYIQVSIPMFTARPANTDLGRRYIFELTPNEARNFAAILLEMADESERAQRASTSTEI